MSAVINQARRLVERVLAQLRQEAHLAPYWPYERIVQLVKPQLGHALADCGEAASNSICYELCLAAAHDLGLVDGDATEEAAHACSILGHEPTLVREPDYGVDLHSQSVDSIRAEALAPDFKPAQEPDLVDAFELGWEAQKAGQLAHENPWGGEKVGALDHLRMAEWLRGWDAANNMEFEPVE